MNAQEVGTHFIGKAHSQAAEVTVMRSKAAGRIT